jgi:molecular chaperone GrpE (heat shock protein)
MQNLETMLSQRLEHVASGTAATGSFDFAKQFQKLDEEIEAIRITEGLNQRLYDSLHDELIKYRDNFLHESLQKPFIRDLLILFDDLSGLAGQLNSAKAENKRNIAQWRENLENAIHALVEILHRLEVKEIEVKDKVDRTLHRVISFEPTEFPEEDGRIVMRLKRGFLWRDGVLRPEEVIAKRFN